MPDLNPAEFLPAGFLWWIAVIEIPVISTLFWLILRHRDHCDTETERLRTAQEANFARLRENLSAYKLEVATAYASMAQLRETEKRLTQTLLRIEAKLDNSLLTKGTYHE